MLPAIEKTRLRISRNTEARTKSKLGQFLTPARIAQFMASLFYSTSNDICRLLDPGAGIGSLSRAFIERCISGDLPFNKVEITAFELDKILHKELENTLSSYSRQLNVSFEIIDVDFIEEAVKRINLYSDRSFSHAILNPPYKKISSDSRHRFLIRKAGIETVNLYSAFVALTLALMSPLGQVVAIIPRSFCNGPYYRPFRNFILERSVIRHMHLFKSRNKAFKDDDVLQENIILLLEKGGKQGNVKITTSTDGSFTDLETHIYPFESIVFPDDPERFIHVPTSPEQNVIEMSPAVMYSLEKINIQVSTGPVVDFRLKNYLCDMPEYGTVPLIYPGHFSGHNIEWPNINMKKPNAIYRNSDTEKWLFPIGFYCVVRRFSSKEEKRRIMASVICPDSFPYSEMLGFENHLNIFHQQKHGLTEDLAWGLAAFLNTTAVDEYFRRFSGHTQVNATDLRFMMYPSRDELINLGKKAKNLVYDQKAIDKLFEGL